MLFILRNKKKKIKSLRNQIHVIEKVDLYRHISVIFTTLLQVKYGLLVAQNYL